jgi:hypothetical protein
MCCDKDYIEQFRDMTPEQIESHTWLEKVRNVMERFPVDFRIDRIRKLMKKIKEEKSNENKTLQK